MQNPSVTDLLQSWRQGDAEALEDLFPMVYRELVSLSQNLFAGERVGHTLQPTALVHEAYIRLVSADVDWRHRAHFFAIAAQTMRRVLVDHARKHGAEKRGGEWLRTTLSDGISVDGAVPSELLDLDRALEQLAVQDPRSARAAELHYFGGLSHQDTAEVLEVSAATVDRDLRLARAWLRRALTEKGQTDSDEGEGGS